jgi:uncharacterized protein (DUF2147 family)
VFYKHRIHTFDRARLARRLGARASGSIGAGLAAALLAGALVGAPSASAAWTAPTDLSAAGSSAFFPEVVVDGDGDFLFVWERDEAAEFRAQARTLSAAGTLGAVQMLSPAGSDARSPHVGVDLDGDAVFAWTREDGTSDRARVRTLSAAGAVGGGQTVSNTGTNGSGPQVAVDEDGDAVVVWYASDGFATRLYGRTRSAAGTLGPILTLSDAGQNAWAGQVAVDPAGDAVFSWQRSDGSHERVQARTLSAAGVLGAVQTLSDAGETASNEDVALDADGNAVFTWHRYDGSHDRVQARTLSAAGVLGAVRTLSDAGGQAYGSRLALDAAGNATIVWQRFDGSNDRVQARTLSSVGTLGLVETLSAAGEPAYNADVAANDDGDAVFAWQRFDGVDWRIQARTLAASGTLGATWTISDAGGMADMPRVAAHDDDAIVTWQRPDGLNERIQYAAGP